MNTNIIVKIPNFDFSMFRNLLEQSLLVNTELMLEFSPDMIKSCSFSSTRTLIKLWTIPLEKMLISDDKITENAVIDLSGNTPTIPQFEKFDLYVLKGDSFKNYLKVFDNDKVDLEFSVIQKENGKFQATNIQIEGTIAGGSRLKTTFVLTTDDLISNKVEDYSKIIDECTPTEDMHEFILVNKQIIEIKKLVKNLHKAGVNNTAFLTFTYKPKENKMYVNDSVFNIGLELNTNELKNIENAITFNVLKSDFIRIGNHTFSIFTNETSEKIIFGAKYGNSIIWIMSSKVDESSAGLESVVAEETMSDIDIAEYL